MSKAIDFNLDIDFSLDETKAIASSLHKVVRVVLISAKLINSISHLKNCEIYYKKHYVTVRPIFRTEGYGHMDFTLEGDQGDEYVRVDCRSMNIAHVNFISTQIGFHDEKDSKGELIWKNVPVSDIKKLIENFDTLLQNIYGVN